MILPKPIAFFKEQPKQCSERLRKTGIDLNSYTTNQIAADINDLINVLEIEDYNLLTMSYSTKIGQVLIRDYPDKIRSVVMDSPLPLEVNYDEESVNNLLESLDKLFMDCETDINCNSAFPNIKAIFRLPGREKTKNPLEVKIENPENGNLETFYLKGEDLINVVSTSTADVPNIPFEINKLLNNDLSSVKQQLQYIFQKPVGGIRMGNAFISLVCAKENPFNSQDKIASENN